MPSNSNADVWASRFKVFAQDELIENILKYLDNDDLLTVRSVSTLWNQEAEKLLFQRNYRKPEPLHANDSLSIQRLHNLLQGDRLIDPSILIGTLSVNLNESLSPHCQMFLSLYGQIVRNIAFDGPEFMKSGGETMLLEFLKQCLKLKTMKLTFDDSYDAYDLSTFNNFIPDPFNGLRKLEHLSTLEFQHTITTYGSNSCDVNVILYYVNMVIEIVKSSGNLKHLILKAYQLANYLEAMSQDLEVKYQLRNLQTLKLYNIRENPEGLSIHEGLAHFLPVVSKSLEVLDLIGVALANVDLSSFPLMCELRTLTLKATYQREPPAMNLCCDSLPKLSTLILGEFDRHPVQLEIGWPIRKGTQGTGFNVLPLRILDNVKDTLSNSPLINVIVYVRWGFQDKKNKWLNHIFHQLSKVNLAALFLDFLTYPCQFSDLKQLCFNKFTGDISGFKNYITRPAGATSMCHFV